MRNGARFLRNCRPISHEQCVFRGACPRKTRDWILFRRLRAAKLGETEAPSRCEQAKRDNEEVRSPRSSSDRPPPLCETLNAAVHSMGLRHFYGNPLPSTWNYGMM